MNPSPLHLIKSCPYVGSVPLDNYICTSCSLFMETCIPIVTSDDGYSAPSECDRYMCEGCSAKICVYNVEK
jgi:hypothetical protein